VWWADDTDWWGGQESLDQKTKTAVITKIKYWELLAEQAYSRIPKPCTAVERIWYI